MKKVLVIFGSPSSEHEVSCLSAANIVENLDRQKYEITMLGMDKSANMFLYTGDTKRLRENTWMEDEIHQLEVLDGIAEFKNYDVIFPVLHGKYGEDGSIQGMFEIANVPYVGCGVEASSIGMDKILCKKIVSYENIPVVDYIAISKSEYVRTQASSKKLEMLMNEIEGRLGFPIIVKPNREGSSYGIQKVEKKEALVKALDFAFTYDSMVLIEKYISPRQEVECAVIQEGEKIYASTPGEILSANEIYDFDAKYKNSKSLLQIPAHISDSLQETIRQYARRIFELLQFSGLARIDFFVSDGKLYFNEVNTLPGFTSTSMYPKMLMYDDISYAEILDILIQTALNNKHV